MQDAKWSDYFQDYSEQIQYVKKILKVDFEPATMCVNCVINQTKRKKLQFDIKCTPLRAEDLDDSNKTPQELLELIKVNPYFFAKHILNVEPREFQKEIIACTQNRKVLRIQRRQGKSHAMAMYMLWYQVTKPKSKVRVIAPRDIQVKELFDKMDEMIKNSKVLINSVYKSSGKGMQLYRKDPYEFMFTNESTIRGITTGDGDGTSVRSQSADLLVLDETDYITEEAFAAVYPLIASDNETEMIQASTPSGKRGYFYNWCHDKSYKEVHKRYQDTEAYNESTFQEFLRNMTKERFEREVLAEFTLQESGVFSNDLIDSALEEYTFDKFPPPHGIYTFGIDWNESVAGVHIVVVRYEPHHNKYRVSNVEIVPPSEFTQLVQIEKIIELFEWYKPKRIVMDEGFGNTQIQALKRWGIENGNEEFLNQLITIPFGGYLEQYDNVIGTYTKVPAKDYIVQLSKRFLENHKLILPLSQDTKTKLVGQMRDYAVEKVLDSGHAKYSKGNVHTLEQMMLQLYGMHDIKESIQNLSLIPSADSYLKPRETMLTAAQSGTIRNVRKNSNKFREIDKLYRNIGGWRL